jgi:hypothetical protein
MRRAAGVAAAALALSACSAGARQQPGTRPTPSSASPSPPASAVGQVRWLCRPGLAHSPCDGPFPVTVIRPGGRHVVVMRAATHPAIDCFYVYPTVSPAPGLNAPLRSEPPVVAAVRAQAALFATQCRLFVPLYRQVTLGALLSGRFYDPHAVALAQSDVDAAWVSYLAHDNHGRGVVLIGHSQGSMRLITLMKDAMDRDSNKRRLLVTAILPGANVAVANGRAVGGTFMHIPVCRRTGETGCVIAYSSFATTPPALSFFGRGAPGQTVVCVDPAQLLGRRDLDPIVPTDLGFRGVRLPRVRTPYAAVPGRLAAHCSGAGGASVLHVAGSVAGEPIGRLQTLGSAWGLHVVDVNLALGDLLRLVHRAAANYVSGG